MYFVDIVGDYDDVKSSRPVSGGVTPIIEVTDYGNLKPPSSDIRIRSTVLVSTGESWSLEFCLSSFVVTQSQSQGYGHDREIGS